MKIAGLFAASALLLAVGQAQALPLGPTAQPDPSIVHVRGGCGFGEHRGPYGGCRLNRGPRGAIRRMMTGAPRGCPPGMVRGRMGRCHY